MRFRLFALFVIVFVCAFSATAQTVIESESSAVFNDKTAELTLVIDSPGTFHPANIVLKSSRLDLARTFRQI